MAIQLPYFDKISFDEANPTMTGFNKGVTNAYLPMEKQQALQQAIYQNMTSKAQVPYANEMAGYARDIAQADAQAAPINSILKNINPYSAAYLAANPDILKKLLSNANTGFANIGNRGVPAPVPNTPGSGYGQQIQAQTTQPQIAQDNPLGPRSLASRGYDTIASLLGIKNPQQNVPTQSAVANDTSQISAEAGNIPSSHDPNEGKMPPPESIWMVNPKDPNRFLIPVHKSQIENAKKRNLIEAS